MAVAKGNRIKAEEVLALLSVVFPTGLIIPYGGNLAPAGWYKCTHVAVSKTAEPALFNMIGYTYGGSGDIFYTPDMSNVVLPTEYSKSVSISGPVSTSVSTTVAIKGNGKGLGLTNGRANGMMKVGSWDNMQMTAWTYDNLPSSNGAYWQDQDNYILGVITNTTDSGLVGSGSGSGSTSSILFFSLLRFSNFFNKSSSSLKIVLGVFNNSSADSSFLAASNL